MLPYYKILSAPDLHKMSAEIDTYLRATCPVYVSMLESNTTSTGLINSNEQTGPRYLRKIKDFKMACPSFADWLDSKGIKSRDIYLISWIVIASRGVNAESMPIHIDTDGEGTVPLDLTGEAINLPLLNFDNSYTAWYSASKLGGAPTSAEFFDSPAELMKKIVMNWSTSDIAYDESSAVELVRASVAQPMYINVSIPHRAINLGDQPRTSLSIRLRRKLDLHTLC
jgi:hypothetical protein